MGVRKLREGGRASPSPSPVVAFLVRRGLARDERRASQLVLAVTVGVALLAAAAWTWAGTEEEAPPAKRYEDMTAAERAALPAAHRLYLEEVAQEKIWREEQEGRARY